MRRLSPILSNVRHPGLEPGSLGERIRHRMWRAERPGSGPGRRLTSDAMLALILNRVLIAIPTLVIVSLFVFALQHALPGDPFLVIAGEERDPEVIARLREIYRMDDPIIVQYFAWAGQVLQGEFGRSLRTGEPVLGLILQKLPVTIQLAVASMIVALAIGLPAGVIAAVRKGTAADYTASAVALSGLSIRISGSASC